MYLRRHRKLGLENPAHLWPWLSLPARSHLQLLRRLPTNSGCYLTLTLACKTTRRCCYWGAEGKGKESGSRSELRDRQKFEWMDRKWESQVAICLVEFLERIWHFEVTNCAMIRLCESVQAGYRGISVKGTIVSLCPCRWHLEAYGSGRSNHVGDVFVLQDRNSCSNTVALYFYSRRLTCNRYETAWRSFKPVKPYLF